MQFHASSKEELSALCNMGRARGRLGLTLLLLLSNETWLLRLRFYMQESPYFHLQNVIGYGFPLQTTGHENAELGLFGADVQVYPWLKVRHPSKNSKWSPGQNAPSSLCWLVQRTAVNIICIAKYKQCSPKYKPGTKSDIENVWNAKCFTKRGGGNCNTKQVFHFLDKHTESLSLWFSSFLIWFSRGRKAKPQSGKKYGKKGPVLLITTHICKRSQFNIYIKCRVNSIQFCDIWKHLLLVNMKLRALG